MAASSGSADLPEFYMPWPARQNPSLAATSEHTVRWAREMGFFAPGNAAEWTEERYRQADFPLFVALFFPDAPGPRLDAISDFNVLTFFFDDYVLKAFTASADVAAARAFVGRLASFMPVDLDAEDRVEPINLVERGFADTWSRIAPSMSRAWRRRFGRHVQEMNESWVWELANAAANRIPDPIEYVEMRRRTGGVYWAADLVEHALGIEVPLEIYASRAIGVLNDTMCDSVLLRNDILSYEKEMQEGETNNGVLVAQAFLGCDLQRAFHVVNDVVTARLHQAENTMTLELGALLGEYPDHQRRDVLAYAQGLRDAMAGDFQWETGTGRYRRGRPVQWLPAGSPVAGWVPTGPSAATTLAARIGADRRMLRLRIGSHTPLSRSYASHFEPPVAGGPPRSRCNPNVDAVRSHARGWAHEMGLLDAEGWRVWDRGRFDAMDLALFGALTHPESGSRELELICDWHVWAFYFDDVFAMRFKLTRDLLGAKALVARLGAFLADVGEPAEPPVALNPVERALADLWSRSTREMATVVRAQLAGHVLEFARGWLWELECLVRQRVPEPLDYVAMCRTTGRSGFAADLVQHALRLDFDRASWDWNARLAVMGAFADAGQLRNDVVSRRLALVAPHEPL